MILLTLACQLPVCMATIKPPICFRSLSSLTQMVHQKSRSPVYPRTNNAVNRTPVPDNKVSWKLPWPEYNPTNYTSKCIQGQFWADPNIDEVQFNPKWNEVDGQVNRKSHVGVYDVVNSVPLNPEGRTGLSGRGVLGRWGPNHAADPIVTRWKRDRASSNIVIHEESKKPILQFVAIQRRDTGEWAIPGGMVDPGEVVTTTLKREFMEEALNTLECDASGKDKLKALIEELFIRGVEVYRGYVDDHRNTDNAWMETIAMNFHDEDGMSVGLLPLCAGDDAVNVRWMDVSKDVSLYASHSDFVAKVAAKHNSHFLLL